MNRFGTGYDDLFAAFGLDSKPSEGPSEAPSAGGEDEADGGADPADDAGAASLAEFLARASEAINDLERPGAGRFGSERGPRVPSMSAPVDVVEVPEGLLIVFDLPGVAEADVELAAAPRAIRLRAARRLPLPPAARALRRERAAGTVERIVPVPAGYDSGALEARFAAGVLAVMVPRHEATGGDRDGEHRGDSGTWSNG